MSRRKTSDRPAFRRLVLRALPDIIRFQTVTGLLLAALSFLINRLIGGVAGTGSGAVTTANMGAALLSWRGPALILLLIALILLFTALELFAQVYLCEDILAGRPVRVLNAVRRGFVAVRRFLTPAGIGILLYILIAVPLCGLGFSISLTSGFYIPNFIMEVIRATPLFNVAYLLLMLALLVVGLRGIFSIHEMLIGGMKPAEGLKRSGRIVKAHWKRFIPGMLGAFAVAIAFNMGVRVLLNLPKLGLQEAMRALPAGYVVDPAAILRDGASDLDRRVTSLRFLCAFAIIGGGYLRGLAVMLTGTAIMLWFTRYYLEFTDQQAFGGEYVGNRAGHVKSALAFVLILAALLVFSLALALFFNPLFDRDERVRVVAHRTGGVMASENSLEGVDLAVEKGCYTSETDVQRTKDGGYIINHDDDFKRLTGVNKKPGAMTMAEIAQLRIVDTTGSGAELPVPTAGEMLLAVKGRIKLFLELKGVSADRRMADDMVGLIRELGCESDVVFISLKYDLIDYIETAYPEFETGVLIFGGIGDVSRLNCDLLIMEEEMSTDARIDAIHAAGKQAFVWTVNTREGLARFLDSEADGVITAQVDMAIEVQSALDNRTDYELIVDRMGDIWEG